MGPARAFTVSDADYFVGTVALLNSLHVTDNAIPLTVLDRGLTAAQRALLEPHCDLVVGRRDRDGYFAKPTAPLACDDADTLVFVDSDILVTRSLAEPLAAAARGSVYVCAEPASSDRWFAEWSELLALRAPLRQEPAVNAGFVVFSRSRVPGLLERWGAICDDLAATAAEPDEWHLSRREPDHPLWLADQDALNALLMSEVPPGRVVIGPPTTMVMSPDALRATKVVDLERLECEWRGEPVTVLHAVGLRKPWQPSAAREMRRTAYVRCLLRVLHGPDVPVRVPDVELVPWLRSGPGATARRWALHAYELPARKTRPWRHHQRARRRARRRARGRPS
jgi:hypothetical protein